MKKIIFTITALFIVVSCFADGLVGTWSKAYNYRNQGKFYVQYSFNEDGNMKLTMEMNLDYAWDMYFIKYNPVVTVPGKYTVEGNVVNMSFDYTQFLYLEKEKISVTGNPDMVDPKKLTKAMTFTPEFRIFKECRDYLINSVIEYGNMSSNKFKISGEKLTMRYIDYDNITHEDKQATCKSPIQAFGAINGKNVMDCMVKPGMTLEQIKAMFAYIENRGSSSDKIHYLKVTPIRTVNPLPKRKFNFEVDVNGTTKKATNVKNVPVVMM